MRRDQLEHVIRAAAAVADDDNIVVIGSQAIHGTVAAPPPEAVLSVEADVFPRDHPERADDIDGAMGDGSMFHDTFGYYAHGVGPETAVAPAGWQTRLVPFASENTRGATGWCMELHDLALAKLVAGRDKDIAFVRVVATAGLIDAERTRSLLETMDLAQDVHARIDGVLAALWPR